MCAIASTRESKELEGGFPPLETGARDKKGFDSEVSPETALLAMDSSCLSLAFISSTLEASLRRDTGGGRGGGRGGGAPLPSPTESVCCCAGGTEIEGAEGKAALKIEARIGREAEDEAGVAPTLGAAQAVAEEGTEKDVGREDIVAALSPPPLPLS